MTQQLLGDALIDHYRGIICDLDGVVFTGNVAVPGAIETLTQLTEAGVKVVFATNNASRTPQEVHASLATFGLGLSFDVAPVLTSAEAAAAYIAKRVAPGTEVLAVGGPGVSTALSDVGLNPLSPDESKAAKRIPGVVVQGAGANITWHDLARAARAVQGGAEWVATNLDPTIPTAWGQAPGNGALVAAVRTATATDPVAVGKPKPDLYLHALERLGLTEREVLVVGDRLDTDIAGAHACGMDSLLVLSGVTSLRDIQRVPPPERPTYIARDLTGLLTEAEKPPTVVA